MSNTNIDYKTTNFEFPVLTKISGQPNYELLKTIKNELKANLLADLKINDFKQNGIVIPTKLIQKDRKGDSYVYTLKKEEEGYLVEKTYIVQKMTYANESFIAEGLLEDALIVDKGARLIKANETVIIAE